MQSPAGRTRTDHRSACRFLIYNLSFSNDNPSHTQLHHHHHHHPPNILNSQISPLPSRVSQTFHGSSALWCLANPISRDEPSLINISKNFSIFNFAKTILIRDKQTQHRVCQLENLTERNVKVWSCVCYNLISMYGLDWTHSDILSPHCSLYFNIQILILYSPVQLYTNTNTSQCTSQSSHYKFVLVDEFQTRELCCPNSPPACGYQI